MRHIQRRGMAVVAAALLALVGAGGTYAATKSSGTSEREAFLNDVAKRLNVDPKDLTTAMREAYFDRLDAAVQAGKLTKEQADAIKKRIQSGGGVPFGPVGGPGGPGGPGPGPGGPDFHRGGPGHGGPIFGGIDAVAKFLGLTEAQLRDELMSGKSLADIAKDKGKSVDDLKAAIKDGVKGRLDDAVKDKKLTQAQEDEILKGLDSHLDDIVNGKPGKFGGKLGHRRWKGGPGGGPPSAPGTYPGSAPAAPAIGNGSI
jgi:hypothetical protein